jgi:hypothetical protein
LFWCLTQNCQVCLLLCGQGFKFPMWSRLFSIHKMLYFWLVVYKFMCPRPQICNHLSTIWCHLGPPLPNKKKHFTDHKWAGSHILAFIDQLPYTHSQTLVYLPNVPNVTMSSWRLLEQKFLLCSITSSQIWLIPLVLVHLTKLKKRIPA